MGYKADKDARDKQEQEGKQAAEQEAALLANEAQVWAAKGQLFYRRIGDVKGKGGNWVPTRGELVEIPEVPGFRFWLSKNHHNRRMNLTEEQSGLSAWKGDSKAEAMTDGIARIIKHKDKLAEIVAQKLADAPPKPELQNWEKAPKKKGKTAVAATPEAAPVAESVAKQVETPEEAASIVQEEIKHVIDTEGLADAKAIHERVLTTLANELPGAERFQQAQAMRKQSHSERITAARESVGPQQPKENHRDYGARIRKAESAVEALSPAIEAITIDIPGDGTFKINRDPKSIQAAMKRIRSGGTKLWQGLDADSLSKRAAGEAAFNARRDARLAQDAAKTPKKRSRK